MDVQSVTMYGHKDGLAELDQQPSFTLPAVSGYDVQRHAPEASAALVIGSDDILEVHFSEPCFEYHPNAPGGAAYAAGRMALTVIRDELGVYDMYEVEVDRRPEEPVFVGSASRADIEPDKLTALPGNLDRSEEEIVVEAITALIKDSNESGPERVNMEARAMDAPINARDAQAVGEITKAMLDHPELFSGDE